MISKNLENTSKIAKIFLNKILKEKKRGNKALIVCLSGDLGSGKTAFIQAIAKHLDIKNKINSPTFVIIKNYKLQKTKYTNFFHIDAYRLKDEKELLHLGWEDIINNKEHIVFIEWPENVYKVIPSDAKFVHIFHTKKNHRNFQFNSFKML